VRDTLPSPLSPPLIATGLHRVFDQGANRVVAISGVDLTVNAGEFVAIMGPSGSGKSTLLHLLGALDRPDRGRVLLEGQDVSSLPEHQLALIRRRRLGFLLQFFSLLPTMTALENVAFPLLLDRKADALARARRGLEAVGLKSRVSHRPAQLSGGEQQRVALARALVAEPAVVLADEPTGSLDSSSGLEILDLLKQTAHAGQAIVVATHDSAAAAYANRELHLIDGRLCDPSSRSPVLSANARREESAARLA